MKLTTALIFLAAVAAALGFALIRSNEYARANPIPVATAAAAPAPAPPEPGVAGKDAEPLPNLPKIDAKSQIKSLLPDDTLYLETTPNGTKRLLVVSEVCLREGPLEVFLCKKNTKEHEAIVRTAVDPRFIHAALVAIGAKPGSPVQFVNQKTDEPEYKPATGAKINVTVHYRRDGQLRTHPAQEWIRDQKTKKPMAHQWVFAGSRFVKNPDRPNDPPFYTANNGEVIAISNFVDSMLDLPVEVSRDNADLTFDAMTDKIPPLLSKVWVILEPAAEKK
ncbi:YdjY domain-containing protein [Fimbriiglobus ruber]|uniref:Uncharacterized protein n=1 Tax=Fimbriiglobus ruber TaxID=1908690 RepID=A0A225E6E7_9BACT|nr:YdjY domain-containing protein [Fimbriiglobus ruber]OWK45069.1 hypothetical protein FRUB_01400 [Fimbriiglobus ruber]